MPFITWGAMPLNNPRGPSFSTMYHITSVKVLNGLPCLAEGGRDCSPTFATMSGCVTSVANAFDRAPRTFLESVIRVMDHLPTYSQKASSG